MAALISPKLAFTLSTGISALDTISKGIAADRVGRFQAAQQRQLAERARQVAGQRAADLRNQEARRRAALRARIGGRGVAFEGSPLAVLSDLAGDAELQALREINEGEFQSSRSEGNARLALFQGRENRRAAFTQTGRTLITAASKNFDNSGAPIL